MKSYLIDGKLYLANSKYQALLQVTNRIYFKGNIPYTVSNGLTSKKIFAQLVKTEYIGKKYIVINLGTNLVNNTELFQYYCNTTKELIKEKSV